MSYVDDKTGHTRGVGAVAALDRDPRVRLARMRAARRTSLRDRILANQALGAVRLPTVGGRANGGTGQALPPGAPITRLPPIIDPVGGRLPIFGRIPTGPNASSSGGILRLPPVVDPLGGRGGLKAQLAANRAAAAAASAVIAGATPLPVDPGSGSSSGGGGGGGTASSPPAYTDPPATTVSQDDTDILPDDGSDAATATVTPAPNHLLLYAAIAAGAYYLYTRK